MGVGIGYAGGVLLNDFLLKDKRFSGLFVNSAFGDTEGLEKFDINKNGFIFAGTSGSGRNREIAKDMLKDQVQGLADTISRFVTQSEIIIFFSLDGGTGSGITPTLARMLHRVSPTKTINLIGVVPNHKKADKISLENTMACWNEIGELLDEDIINDVKFIDNSTRNTYKEINEKAMEDLILSFNMNGKCEYGSIDDNDAKRVNTAKGFGLVLNLDGKYRKLSDAIDHALEDTVFAKPNNYLCDYLGVSLKDFDVIEAKEQFEPNKTAYVANNNDCNVISLGGCEEPSEIIENIKLAYDLLLEKEKNREKSKRTVIDIKAKGKKDEEKELKTNFTAKELDNLFDDLF